MQRPMCCLFRFVPNSVFKDATMRDLTPYLRPSTLVAICADLQHSSEQGEDEEDFKGDWDAALEMLIDTMGEKEAKEAIAAEMQNNF